MVSSAPCRPIRVTYDLAIPTIGNRLIPELVTALCGLPTRYAAGSERPTLFAGGSLMGATTPRSVIWGTGVRDRYGPVGAPAAAHIHALRGQLSHAALCAAGVALGDVPLGDLGFLAPGLLGVARAAKPTARLGIVTGWCDRANPLYTRLAAAPGVVRLDRHDDPAVFLQAMAACGAVISSALHGLVLAEALGIPNLWLTTIAEPEESDFGYHDWFSTTRRPQTVVHRLIATESVDDLIARTALHDSAIDRAALRAAFPADSLEECRETMARVLVPVAVCRARPLPVFLISFNLGAILAQAIRSLKRQNKPTEIVVQDNASTDPATLATLDQLAAAGTCIIRRPPIHEADDLNKVDETVQAFFADWAEPQRYAVSDCDIDMAIAAPDALDVYAELLNLFPRFENVGPMLRIRDIPRHYPLYNRVMNRHIEQFWHRTPRYIETSFGRVAYLPAVIDTTLSVHRAGEAYRRFKLSHRVYEPYEAWHLDWYVEVVGADAYSTTSSNAIAHWNNVSELRAHADAVLEHEAYLVVRFGADGTLETYRETLGF